MTASMTATGRDDRVLLIKELAKLSSDAKGAIPGLEKLKFDPDAEVRKAAAEAIEAIKG